MNFLLFLTFFLWAIFSILSQSGTVFHKYNLSKEGWDKYRTGYSRRRIKSEIVKNRTNPQITSALKDSLLLKNISTAFFILFLITFIVIIISNISVES